MFMIAAAVLTVSSVNGTERVYSDSLNFSWVHACESSTCPDVAF